ncbi:MAG: hypothetical protein HOG49_07475 [Candidatus Scalindua sp.]|jgi:hypothetical protein|nr:hypothetical protein [Candidatus Scalindua sp.]
MSDIGRYSVKQSGNLGLGQGGFNSITDTALNTGNWVAFKAVHGDAIIASSTSATGDNLPASMTLSEGDVVYGDFTAVTLSSGKILAYIG